jgi:hypothetical protein
VGFLNGFGTVVQAIAAVAIAVLTWSLVRINARYAKTTSDALKLSQEQLDRQQRVYAEFGLLAEGGNPMIWVANLGSSSFLVSAIKIRRIQKLEPETAKINSIVPAGESKRLDLPSSLYDAYPTQSFAAFDVCLVCVSSGETRDTKWRAFTLYESSGHRVTAIKAGIHDLWPLECPKCKTFDMMCMVTDGLQNFDEALERQKFAQQELATSCPNHSSRQLHGGK